LDDGTVGEGGVGDAREEEEGKRNETVATSALENGSSNVGHLRCLKA
jgi:hypothetical protein